MSPRTTAGKGLMLPRQKPCTKVLPSGLGGVQQPGTSYWETGWSLRAPGSGLRAALSSCGSTLADVQGYSEGDAQRVTHTSVALFRLQEFPQDHCPGSSDVCLLSGYLPWEVGAVTSVCWVLKRILDLRVKHPRAWSQQLDHTPPPCPQSQPHTDLCTALWFYNGLPDDLMTSINLQLDYKLQGGGSQVNFGWSLNPQYLTKYYILYIEMNTCWGMRINQWFLPSFIYQSRWEVRYVYWL